jgi:uncharacterized protein (DUF952 family)
LVKIIGIVTGSTIRAATYRCGSLGGNHYLRAAALETRPALGVYWGRAVSGAWGPGRVAQVIYKICRADEWREAERAGAFRGAAIDLTDGYIHFSTGAQAAETAARHFVGADDLVLVAVAAAALGPALKWEPSRGGAQFPHLYGVLTPDAVLWVKPLPLGGDGRHIFPELDP